MTQPFCPPGSQPTTSSQQQASSQPVAWAFGCGVSQDKKRLWLVWEWLRLRRKTCFRMTAPLAPCPSEGLKSPQASGLVSLTLPLSQRPFPRRLSSPTAGPAPGPPTASTQLGPERFSSDQAGSLPPLCCRGGPRLFRLMELSTPPGSKAGDTGDCPCPTAAGSAWASLLSGRGGVFPSFLHSNCSFFLFSACVGGS